MTTREELEHALKVESEAENRILAWCRGRGKQQTGGHPVMRDLHPEYAKERKVGRFAVLDVNRTEPVSGSKWERQDIIYASGETWIEVEDKLFSQFS
jgi:hypothetical protein